MPRLGALLVSLSLLTAIVITIRRRKSKALPRPPGPKGLPIVGNILQMPSTLLWEKASQWGKEFGDMVYVELLGRPMLFLNSYEDAVELLSNRSAIYSSRPHSVMSIEVERWDWLTINVPYGDRFRKHRAFQHRFINSPDILNYLDVQLNETRKILGEILKNPEAYGECLESLPGKVMMLNLYGHQVEKNDRYINLGLKSVRYLSEAAEQYFILDVLPWLTKLPEWTPFVKFHRVGKEARKTSKEMLFDLYNLTKERLAQGIAKESMTSVFLAENMRNDGTIVDEEVFCASMATLFIGAVDTSSTVLMTFVLAMLKNPEAQRTAQLEIDRVVGTDRLPTFEDRENLPYIQALCAEILRFATVTPFTLPHYTTADDEYKGYHIPAGTSVFANLWDMGKNPELNDDPMVFKPERWLRNDVNKESNFNKLHPKNYVFGFGRRVCPGQKLAENMLFITAASMLAAFNIEKAIGENGETIEPNESFLQTFVRTLGPSKCKITPRSSKIASLVRHFAEDN